MCWQPGAQAGRPALQVSGICIAIARLLRVSEVVSRSELATGAAEYAGAKPVRRVQSSTLGNRP